ncbi:MAG TPA: prohead protease/major capsid protein fusion protein [Xanthobacteraceae bacterium]|nr:prohead protease/major capsid protein fusion protein [Xanthobacteraceae bacterium]
MLQILTRDHPEVLTRAEAGGRTTWNPADRTFTVVMSSGAPVTRADARGVFNEVIDLATVTIPTSVPLLDAHSRRSVDDQLGEVTNIRIENGVLVGTGRLSQHNQRAQRLAAEMADGATFAASIGYEATGWAERANPSTGRRERVSTGLRLLETSLLPVGADPAAGTRSAAPISTTAPVIVDRAAVNAEIRSIARTVGLGQDFVDAQIDAGATADGARAAAFAALQSRSSTTATVRSQHNTATLDNPEVRARAIGEALYARHVPSHQVTHPAREFIGMTTLDLARDCLRIAGIQTTGLSPATVIERALLTTSDFPAAYGEALDRTLRRSYQAAPSGIRQLSRQTTTRDFRNRVSISYASDLTLEKVNEHGEFKSGALVKTEEAYHVDTFGKIVGLTRQMLVNDDIGAFVDLAGRLGQAAAAFEASFLLARLTSNPLMSDGKAVFHADHGNLAASGGAIAEATLSAARLALRSQTDAGGNLISVTPRYLLVGRELETAAEKFLASITPAKVDDTNVFSGRLSLIVEPRLTGASWYVVADPGEIPCLEYSYLEGEPGPQIAQEVGFDVDGVRFRVREVFGGGWTDHRGWFRNAGA